MMSNVWKRDTNWVFIGSLMILYHYVGLPLQLIVLPLFGFILGSFLIKYRSERLSHFCTHLFRILIFIYPIFVLSVQLVRLKMGGQGVDFAIFAQSVHNFSLGGSLETSLIDWKPHNFLTHHFSPYLLVIGFVNRLFDSSEIVLLVLHSLVIAAVLHQIFLFATETNKDSLLGYNACCLAILSPAPRIGLLFEVRDEIFALPFLLAGYRTFLSGRHRTALACLAATFLFKETLFIASAAFCLMAILHICLQSPHEERRYVRYYAVMGSLAVIGFVFYATVLPGWIFWPTFCSQCRISTFEQLTDWSVLTDKLYWACTLVAPHLPIVSVALFDAKRRGSLLSSLRRIGIGLLPAASFIGMIAISNFPPSYNPFNYYSIVPSLLLLLTSLDGMRLLPGDQKKLLIIIGCLIAIFIGPKGRFAREWNQAITSSSPVASLGGLIPQDAIVVAGDYDVTFFIRQHRIIRLFHANRNRLPFDFILQRKNGPSPSILLPLSRFLKDRSRVCFEDANWIVRCAKNGVLDRSEPR